MTAEQQLIAQMGAHIFACAIYFVCFIGFWLSLYKKNNELALIILGSYVFLTLF